MPLVGITISESIRLVKIEVQALSLRHAQSLAVLVASWGYAGQRSGRSS
jgi:hypothetical protein